MYILIPFPLDSVQK